MITDLAPVERRGEAVSYWSIAVYGGSTIPPMTEETAVSPEDSYGIAKHAVELELRACREMFGLNYVIFRPHNVFGPRQNVGDRYRNVVGIFMNQISQGLPMTIFGDGTQTRAFSYIDDVAPLMAEAIDVPACWNQTFNIGADRPYSLLQLATAVSAAMGLPSHVTHLEARREVQHAHSTHDKARRVFGPRPETSLEEGLGRMAAWVRQHGVRTSAPFDAIEIAKNLPASWQTR